jgi:hypothetical protein
VNRTFKVHHQKVEVIIHYTRGGDSGMGSVIMCIIVAVANSVERIVQQLFEVANRAIKIENRREKKS